MNSVSTTQWESWNTSASASDATTDVIRKNTATQATGWKISGITNAQITNTPLPPARVASVRPRGGWMRLLPAWPFAGRRSPT